MSIQDRMNLDTPMGNVRMSPAVDQVAIAQALAGPSFDQNQHDYAMMTLIAQHLVDNPAPTLSGRQCAEFVEDARDRLYGGVTIWNKLIERAPCALGEQADVLFCGHNWGWPMLGMVTRYGTLEEWTAKTGSADHYPGVEYEWSVYDQENDRYTPWEHTVPVTMWLYRPDAPPIVDDADG